MMMGHGFRTTGEKVGWKNDVQGREAAYAAKCWAKTPEVIIQAAERLRGVQIENRPAVELIRRFNYQNVLIYADPPYMLGTRQNRKQYRHEMTDDDHMELLEAIKAHRGPAIISGYDSDLYNIQKRKSPWCDIRLADIEGAVVQFNVESRDFGKKQGRQNQLHRNRSRRTGAISQFDRQKEKPSRGGRLDRGGMF